MHKYRHYGVKVWNVMALICIFRSREVWEDIMITIFIHVWSFTPANNRCDLYCKRSTGTYKKKGITTEAPKLAFGTQCRELPLCAGLGKGVSGKPCSHLCNARRPRLEPGIFWSQTVRLYHLHQARPKPFSLGKKIPASLRKHMVPLCHNIISFSLCFAMNTVIWWHERYHHLLVSIKKKSPVLFFNFCNTH